MKSDEKLGADEKERMSYKEFAFELGYSYATIRVYASQGRIQVVRPKGRRPYILRSYAEEVKKNGF
ncbi:MAG: hypothetical protein IAC42_03335 [Spirochaetes bacterium]|uniref:Helix-turn-helix domain-containing protein n=1 Tax=Candidatus Aphodenecus pullistercoris TaxID=2840669 RepID=A0A9D9E7S9_9SPIR|nr:hypothetical protein [Candidatus Aphodenecus pullistercoris]